MLLQAFQVEGPAGAQESVLPELVKGVSADTGSQGHLLSIHPPHSLSVEEKH